MASNTVASYENPPLRLRIWLETASLLRVMLITIWVTTWYHTLMGLQGSWWKSFFVLTSVLLGSHYLTRFFNHFHWSGMRSRIIFLVWMAIVLVVSLNWIVFPSAGLATGTFAHKAIQSIYQANPDLRIFLHLLVVILLTWRGVSLAQSSMDQGEALRSFQVGIAMLLLYGLLFGSSPSLGVYWPIYLFLLIGLLSLATTRITDLSFMRGGRLPGTFRSWGLPILIAAVTVTGLALLSGRLLSEQVGALSTLLVAVFFIVVFFLSIIVAAPFLLIIYLIMPWLQKWFAQGLELMPIENPQVLADQIFGDELKKIAESTTGIDRFYLYLFGFILVALIVLVLVNLRNQNRNRRIAATGEDTQNISPSPFLGQGPLLDNSFFGRFRNANRYLAAARIRRIYAQLTDLAEKLGLRRPPAATPLEFLPALSRVFPESQSQLETITSAYLKVRYGELPETDAEVHQVSDAWEQVRTHGRKLLQEKKKEEKENKKTAG